MAFLHYLTFIISILTILTAWCFSDWKNWKLYYPTIIFTIALDFASTILTYNYSLWYFKGTLFLPNHVLTDMWMKLVFFPPLIIIYLSHYPYQKTLMNQGVYITLWSFFWGIVEGFYVLVGLTTHHNGWHMGWSAFVWVLMFIGIRLHHTRPLLTWVLCGVFAVFLIIYFNVPINKLK